MVLRQFPVYFWGSGAVCIARFEHLCFYLHTFFIPVLVCHQVAVSHLVITWVSSFCFILSLHVSQVPEGLTPPYVNQQQQSCLWHEVSMHKTLVTLCVCVCMPVCLCVCMCTWCVSYVCACCEVSAVVRGQHLPLPFIWSQDLLLQLCTAGYLA